MMQYAYKSSMKNASTQFSEKIMDDKEVQHVPEVDYFNHQVKENHIRLAAINEIWIESMKEWEGGVNMAETALKVNPVLKLGEPKVLNGAEKRLTVRKRIKNDEWVKSIQERTKSKIDPDGNEN